jgi:hypothetical protein
VTLRRIALDSPESHAPGLHPRSAVVTLGNAARDLCWSNRFLGVLFEQVWSAGK